jgi:predicted nucleic acid-binding protein
LTFFVDANVFICSIESGSRGDACRDILSAVATEQAAGTTSVSVIEEVWHVELSRRGPFEGLTSGVVDSLPSLLPVSPDALAIALRLDVSRAGANDRLHVATCILHEIEVVVSADRDFDAFEEVRRVDPTDADAVAELLG